MRRIVFIVMCFAAASLAAQTKDATIQQKLDNVKTQLEDFDTEHLLDSLDQEKLPRLVSGGLFGGGNLSNFIITRDHHTMSSYMRIGAELGGFMNFNITKHFVIEPQVILTAHQNYFKAKDQEITDVTDRLWSFGVEIPLYFLGRFGNMEKGYIQFGGGVYTHFTYLSNVRNKYTPWDETKATEESEYKDLYQLHNNHFGVCLMVGYEFSFGMLINASYKVSFSDIATFYKQNKGQAIANALIYPQSISLSIGYHWR